MNTVISYSSLSSELKKAFKSWLNFRQRDLISFPFQGKHMKGYIFDHETKKYLVVMQLSIDDSSLGEDEFLSFSEEF
jgi:hypothetical protein